MAVAEAGDFFRGLNGARPELIEALGVPYLTDCVIERVNARHREDAWRGEVTAGLRALCGFVGARPERLGAAEIGDAEERLERLGVRIMD